MAGEGQFPDLELKRLTNLTDEEPKTLMDNVSNNFYENHEYKTTSDKCRSHQTLSFKRNLLDLEFNAAQGDSGTKKCTEDLIDLFERKSNATTATPDTPVSPRRKENFVPEHKEGLLEQTGTFTNDLAESNAIFSENESDSAVKDEYLAVDEDHLTGSVKNLDEHEEDLNKKDDWSFDYESTDGTIDKVETPRENEDKFSEIDDIQSDLVDFDNAETIINNIESISDKIELNDNISTEGDGNPAHPGNPAEDILTFDLGETDDEAMSILNRIKILKHNMDKINSQIATEKDLLREEKLELENHQSLVSLSNNNDACSVASFRIGMTQDPKKSLEEIRMKERKLKLSFQMKQLEETDKMCASELQLMSNTASQVNQLNQDMADYTQEIKLSYATLKNNDYSLSSQRSVTSTGQSPRGSNNSPRLSIGSERNTSASLSSFSNDTKSFDRSLMSPIEFTMGDTRLQMKAADHFKMKISQLEAQLNSGNFHPPPRMSTNAGVVNPPPNPHPGPMKALL